MLDKYIDGLPVVVQIIFLILSLVIGVIFLIKFCNVFVDSSSLVAKKFGIPSIIIGLTVVAMGTSIPELAVSISDSISSAVDGVNSNIAFSNVVGSNISNLLLVLAFAGIFTPIVIKKENKFDYIILLFISSLLTVFAILFGFNSLTGNNAILRWEAIILVVFIVFYISYIINNAKKKIGKISDDEDRKNIKILKPIILILISIAFIAIGGELVVFGAKGMALKASNALHINKDVAETLIGLTIVALGTSLPELVTTIVASKKGENELAFGNVVGSNMFNIIFVLGISATILPVSIASYMMVDLMVMLGATMLVFMFSIKGKLTRRHSYFLLFIYLVYIVYLILRTIL